MEKIVQLLPMLTFLIIIFFFRFYYARYMVPKIFSLLIDSKFTPWIIREIFGTADRNSIEEEDVCVFYRMIISFPVVVVIGPIFEECIFRMPIILFFNSISFWSIFVITVQALIFGFLHVIGPGLNFHGDLREKKVASFFTTCALGVACGYYGVKYQSLWLCVAIHAMWNLFAFSIKAGSSFILFREKYRERDLH